MKLDREMMEGVYGRSVSAIEVLRGWEAAPVQFKSLFAALQVRQVFAAPHFLPNAPLLYSVLLCSIPKHCTQLHPAV